jgi:hypothetical protein
VNKLHFGRPGAQRTRLREAIYWRLIEHHRDVRDGLPTSNRFLLYELRQHQPGVLFGAYSRSEGRRSQDQNLSDASKWLRDEGLVPWPWIVDERRHVTAYSYADSVAEWLAEALDDARINPWGGAPPPLIVCESAAFGGVLERTVALDYLCPVAPTSGQVGGFLHTNIAPRLRGNQRPVLYVGDLDLSGAQIEANTRRVLVQATGERDWRRIALTDEQVRDRSLPTVMKTDKRYRPPRQHEAIEVEALGQAEGLGIVRAALDAMLPEALDDVQVREPNSASGCAGCSRATRDRRVASSRGT